ncbi:MAG TPA: SGNH/GDSL hydrolase family protein [Chthoniobacterales bacterium]|nr:SGNH/GDSL hydrolase family protein [Chthoniobacterales bacterium]
MKKSTVLVFSLMIAALGFSIGSARAAQLVVFGDSLSDNGNTLAAAGVPQPPYYSGRFTNGPNWVDYFTNLAQLPPATAYLQNHGTNFAVGGSTSPLLGTQITAYLAANGGRANKDDLFAIWIGGNDFRAGVNPTTTLDSIQSGLALLRSAGAEKIVLLDLPDISLTPDIIAAGGAVAQAAKQFVTTVNTSLQSRILLQAFLLGIKLTYVDVNATFTQIVERPVLFGFSNSSGAAFNTRTGVVQPNPNSYVFWDGFHPTTPVHYICAQMLLSKLRAPANFLSLIEW